MTLGMRYTASALERIRSLGEKELIKFISDLPDRTVSPLLPPVDGFRRTSNLGLDVRRKTFAKFLLNGAGATPDKSQRAQGALIDIWKQWGRDRIKDKAILDVHFDKLDEYAKSGESRSDELQTFPTNLAAELFLALRDLSVANKCSRENVDRFFQFSPFDETPEIKDAIEQAKSAAKIEEEGEFAALPKRLKADEASIQQLQLKLNEAQSQLTKVVTEQRELKKDVSSLRPLLGEAGRLGDLRGALDKFSKTQDRIEKDWNQKRDADIAARKKIVERIEKIERGEETSRLANVLETFSERLVVLERNPEIQSLSQALKDIGESVVKLKESAETRISEIATDIDGRFFDTGEQITSAISALNQKLELLSNQFEALPRTPSAAVSWGGPAASSQLDLHKFSLPDGAALTTLSSQEGICASLAKSLQGLGLKKTGSEVLAEEILAACLSRQPVFFRGAMALAVARCCAATLAAESSYRISIPLGLCDPEALSRSFKSARANEFSGIAAIVVEGVNRSSFDISAISILDAVRGDHWSRNSNSTMLVFCALVSGMGALPVEPEHIELGPVFDMSCLDWKRGARTENLEHVWGRLGKGVWKSLEVRASQQIADLEEATAVLRKTSSPPSTEIENNIVCALRVIAMLRKSPEISPLQSVAFGWIAPYWQALGISHDVADGELDGGKVDNPHHPDGRLERLLRSGFTADNDTDSDQ